MEKTYNLTEDEKFAVLLEEYRPMIHHIINRCCLSESLKESRDDLFQEGSIALYEAKRTYRKDSTASFGTFAYVVIRRRIVHYLRKEYKQKSLEMFSLDALPDADYHHSLIDRKNDPAQQLRYKLESKAIGEFIQRLSPEDKDILSLRHQKVSYANISNRLGIPRKRVDNRLQSMKKRYQHMKEEDE